MCYLNVSKTLLLFLFLVNCVQAQITFQSVTAGSATTATQLTIASVPGGTDQAYMVTIVSDENVDVTSVSGGSLTWFEDDEQCASVSGGGNAYIYRAIGSPSTFTLTIDVASATTIIAHANRYTGHDTTTPTEDPTGENTNGEDGACSGGTNNSNLQVTSGSTNANSMHVVASSTTIRTITTPDSDYTERATTAAGSGGGQARLYTHDFIKSATGDDQVNHTLNNTTSWSAVSDVLIVDQAGAARRRFIGVF